VFFLIESGFDSRESGRVGIINQRGICFSETLIAAKYTKDRRCLLEDPNLSLEVLRFQINDPTTS